MTQTETQSNTVSDEAVETLAKVLYDKELHHLPFRDARLHLREIYLSRARETLEKELQAVCICWVTDESTWTRYGSSVEPGSQMEPNPDCPEHFPNPSSI